MACKKASDIPLVEPGTKEWKAAVEDIRNTSGHGNNYRASDQNKAKQLLDEAKPGTLHSKPDPRGAKKTPYRHEYHRRMEGVGSNGGLDHDLEHIKWTDYSKKADGHIFYDKWK